MLISKLTVEYVEMQVSSQKNGGKPLEEVGELGNLPRRNRGGMINTTQSQKHSHSG